MMAALARKQVHRTGTKVWRQFVEHRLQDGYGVEDIALWLACPVEYVRAHVRSLRKSGELMKWWGR